MQCLLELAGKSLGVDDGVMELGSNFGIGLQLRGQYDGCLVVRLDLFEIQ